MWYLNDTWLNEIDIKFEQHYVEPKSENTI
jgi:hypothetical protein